MRRRIGAVFCACVFGLVGSLSFSRSGSTQTLLHTIATVVLWLVAAVWPTSGARKHSVDVHARKSPLDREGSR
jgi:hypothetical protein